MASDARRTGNDSLACGPPGRISHVSCGSCATDGTDVRRALCDLGGGLAQAGFVFVGERLKGGRAVSGERRTVHES